MLHVHIVVVAVVAVVVDTHVFIAPYEAFATNAANFRLAVVLRVCG